MQDEESVERNSREIRKRRQRLLIAWIVVIAFFIVALSLYACGQLEPSKPLDIPIRVIGCALILGVVALNLLTWRCPLCNRHLGKDLSVRFCPKCGARLREEGK